MAAAAVAALTRAQTRPDIAEFLDPCAGHYVRGDLPCLHAAIPDPPAPYRDRLLTDAHTALEELLGVGDAGATRDRR